MKTRAVKCSRCGYEGPECEFQKGRDFFQHTYIAACPKRCGNRQSPGEASFRAFGGDRPFVYVDRADESGTVIERVVHRSTEAS